MTINKIVTGFVIQSFDTDTQKFTGQNFVAGGTDYETADGDRIESADVKNFITTKSYLPLEMVQPV